MMPSPHAVAAPSPVALDDGGTTWPRDKTQQSRTKEAEIRQEETGCRPPTITTAAPKKPHRWSGCRARFATPPRGKGEGSMTDRPVDLDEHRGMAAQKETDIRLPLHEVQPIRRHRARGRTNSKPLAAGRMR
jgi:hypothetical protein